MIKLVSRLIILFIINLIALVIAAYFVQGFSISLEALTYIKLAAIFTLLNIIVRPVLKLLLSPLVLITFGLGIIVINALLLYLLARLYPAGITIAGLYPLVYATLVISAVHFIIGFAAKRAYKQ